MCGVGARLPGALWRCIINSLLQSCLVKFMIKGADSYWRCGSSLFNRSFRIVFSYLPIIYYPLPSERQIGNSSHVSDDYLFLWRNIVQHGGHAIEIALWFINHRELKTIRWPSKWNELFLSWTSPYPPLIAHFRYIVMAK